jgi:SpoVK/Ycf46/Vps4 family AAA+-type ATPase
VYTATEWLADNRKKYRSVFDVNECSYVYCEFSFFNLEFRRSDWFLKMTLVCTDQDKKEVCRLKCDRNVSKNNNVVFVREGWGTKIKGSFWKKGTYKWEAYIEDELVAEKYFYVYDFGKVTDTFNPYFDIEKLKLYEGPESNSRVEMRRYYNQFNFKDTRYVWVELACRNKIQNVNYWTCELNFNFRTSSNLLKGAINKLFFIYPQDEGFNVNVGWGSDKSDSWSKDDYFLDILFMDKLILSKKITFGDDYVLAKEEDFKVERPKLIVPADASPSKGTKVRKELNEESLEEVLADLNSLIGLTEVKEKVKEYSKYLQFISLRKEKGVTDQEKINLHSIFKGNPGTGKTTVARKLGKIYKELGLLSKGHVHEVDRTDLIAEFIGQTAPKTKNAIKKAKGGILFIDEAYALARKDDDSKDFGKEAIEILLKELSDGEDIAIIAAGYPDEMDYFTESNPGLKSRFNMTFDFADYLPQELMEIAEFSASKKSIRFSDEAKEAFYKMVVEAYRNRDKFFGNARLMNTLVDECKMNLGLRVMTVKDPASLTVEDLSTIELEDVEKLTLKSAKSLPDIPIDEDLLKESLDKLDRMIGLEKVKQEVKELVKLVRFYKETGKDVRQNFSLHSVFTGNPGTGKTTVARILALIFKSLGIIERGNLVECDRQSLVGGYVGQTAIKTGQVIDSAMGGVLFIDEAYSLTEGGGSDYGKEAIEILLKRMEDFRGQFIVIAAGYTQNMKHFLESNPGLKSRFDRVFQFEDFNKDQLVEIAMNQFNEHQLKLDKKAESKLHEVIEALLASKDDYFGNGRSVRKVVEEAVRKQHVRLAEVPHDKRSTKMIQSLKAEDLQDISVEDKTKPDQLPGIGFRLSGN